MGLSKMGPGPRRVGGLALALIAAVCVARAPRVAADDPKPKTTEELLAELLKQAQAQNELLAKQAGEIAELQKKLNGLLLKASPPAVPASDREALKKMIQEAMPRVSPPAPHPRPPADRILVKPGDRDSFGGEPSRGVPGAATATGLPGIIGYPQTTESRGFVTHETRGRSYTPSYSAYLMAPTSEEKNARFNSIDEPDLMTTRAHGTNGITRVNSPGFFTQRDVVVARDGRSMKFLAGPATTPPSETKIPDWLHLPEPKTKLGLCFSNARDKTLEALNDGNSDVSHKGFEVEVARLDTQLKMGSAVGNVAGQYYRDRDGVQDDIDINEAYADFHVPMPEGVEAGEEGTTSMKKSDRLLLRLGKAAAPFGLYGDSKWTDWEWLEIPLVYARFMPNHLNALGVSVDWRLNKLPSSIDTVVSLSVLNAFGDDMESFMGDGSPIAGHARSESDNRFALGNLAASARWNSAFNLCHAVQSLGFEGSAALHLGAEVVHGPNGAGQSGDTWMYGGYGRFLYLGCPRCEGLKPSGLVFEGEWVERQVFLEAVETSAGIFPRANLTDTGFYGSLVYTLAEDECIGILTFGAKYENVYGRGDNFGNAGSRPRRHDSLARCDRDRWSGLVSWQPGWRMPIFGHFSFSAEYLYDDADSLRDTNHTVVFGIQVR